ncbi:MAG: hypothetical protein AAFO07_21585 [Bacteroidota bacterium]
MKKKIVYGLAFLHLLLISLSVFHLIDEVLKTQYISEPLSFISTLNYSVWRYGFFSPDVGKTMEVEMLLYEDESNVLKYSTVENFNFFTANGEAENRFYGFKAHTAADTTFLDLCSLSACTRMLNLHDGAWRIDYTVRSIRYPTMEGFQNRDTIEITPIYTTSFEVN